MKFTQKLLAASLFVAMNATTAQAQRFPKPSDFGIPIPTIIPTPTTSNNGPSDTHKALGTGAGCLAGGVAGGALGDFLNRRFGDAGGREARQVVFVSATVGCVVGGAAARKIIENMQESAKQAQEEAWVEAQAQTEPVEWSDPNTGYMGTVELVEIEQLPDGKKCGTRRNFTQSPDGEAENFVRVCENDSGDFVPLEV